MKKNIKLAVALGLIGAVSAHADNLWDMTDSPLTTNLVVGVGDSWEAGEGNFIVTETGSIDASTSDGRFRLGVSNVGSILTIEGGSVDIGTSDTVLIGNGHALHYGLIDLQSGTLDIDGFNQFYLGRQNATGILRIQGGEATIGSTAIIFDDLAGNGSIDFTTANSGTLTITGADYDYYEGLYTGTATDLTFNGGNSVAFDEQFSVTGSTITAIPEPATLGMVAAFGGGILFIRRRFMI